MKGPYFIDDFGDYAYVVDSKGERIAECESGWKAQLVRDALNARFYLTRQYEIL